MKCFFFYFFFFFNFFLFFFFFFFYFFFLVLSFFFFFFFFFFFSTAKVTCTQIYTQHISRPLEQIGISDGSAKRNIDEYGMLERPAN
jgi:hypothetical protein